MGKSVLFGGVAAALIIFGAIYFALTPAEKNELPTSSAPSAPTNLPASETTPEKAVPEKGTSSSEEMREETAWKLDSSNFEHHVAKCFQSEACELDEDPTVLYQYFKKSGNRKAMDLLISYLRKYLKDPKYGALYKKPLKDMIDDFYPGSEKQFQVAAYYNYLGDLDRSLALYLDLEEKAAVDKSLKPAPKLNIANTYYDLGRARDALPYYRAALSEYVSHGPEKRGPGHDDIIRFIERRIEEIRAKLNS